MRRKNDQEPLSLPPGWRLPNEQAATPGEKDPDQMSIEELEAETERLRWEETKAEYDRLAERQRANQGTNRGESQFGLASNQERISGLSRHLNSLKRNRRPYWR